MLAGATTRNDKPLTTQASVEALATAAWDGLDVSRLLEGDDAQLFQRLRSEFTEAFRRAARHVA